MTIVSGEIWLAAVGLEGRYEVSSLGRVRSIIKGPPGRILKQAFDGDGYPMITLSLRKRAKQKKVHQLVCRAFHGPPNEVQREVSHLDGTRTNNRADNLKWASHAENLSHREAHGTILRGDRHPRALLTYEIAADIRRRRHERCAVLAAEYGVSRHTIYDVWQGKNWV